MLLGNLIKKKAEHMILITIKATGLKPFRDRVNKFIIIF